MKSRLWAISLVTLVAKSLYGSAYAQSVEDQLAQYERNLIAEASSNGLEVQKIVRLERSLGEGGEDTRKLEDLPTIGDFVAIGVCDEDCDGLGLVVKRDALVSGKIETLADDLSGTDTPVVQFATDPFSPHSIEISVLSCTTLICGYAVDIHQLKRPE